MDYRTEAEALSLLVDRVDSTLEETGRTFPYYADPETGEWETTSDGNWCGGYWVHMLWMAHEVTGNERFADAARSSAEIVAREMPDETMFRGLCFNYAGFASYEITSDDRDRVLGLRGADSMVEYYHEAARQIPVGVYQVHVPADVENNFRGPDDEMPGHHNGVVDAIHAALTVLWRAYHETGDPRYRDVAVSHADRHLDWYVREDGSSWHVARFDPRTGELRAQFNDLAHGDDSCWARGVGWNVAGLARAYTETRGERYLTALERVATYYVEHAPADLVPHYDFEHPDKPNIPRDTSCAALACYGLNSLPEEPETEELRKLGERILESLITQYLTPVDETDERPRGMVLHGCFDGPAGYADDNELIWTDHYLLATLFDRVHCA